ncbi:MAG: hypothetical protein JNM93_07670 [Bacteriovoracaceae bacterium]|nr:hypothetical protein [Bacteriovoracaceae bacterium]
MKFFFVFITLVFPLITFANNCNQFVQKSKSLKEIKHILRSSEYELNAYDFEKLTLDDLKKYFLSEFIKAEDKLNTIINNQSLPSFNNTLLALEKLDLELNRAHTLLSHIDMTNQSPDTTALIELFEKLYQQLSDKQKFSQTLFKRIEAVYQKQQIKKTLDNESFKLLKDAYENFQKSGINLPKEQQTRLSVIEKNLTDLSKEFEQNILKHKKEIVFYLDESEVDGIPDYVLKSASELAEKIPGHAKYLFSPQFGNSGMVTAYATSPEVRLKAYLATEKLAQDGVFNNTSIVYEIIKLRHEKAQILGKENYAELSISDKMAKSEKNVLTFLETLRDVSRPYAIKEKELLLNFYNELTQKNESNIPMSDRAYYGRLFSEKLDNFDTEMVRPYFEMNNTLTVVFDLVEKLYQVKFIKVNIPTSHPDVYAYRVYDQKTESDIGLFYFDPYARPEKNGGAWSMGRKLPVLNTNSILCFKSRFMLVFFFSLSKLEQLLLTFIL